VKNNKAWFVKGHNKGKTYEEIYGDRAQEQREKRRQIGRPSYLDRHTLNCKCCICKAKRHENKGKSYIERYGLERAFIERKKRSVKRPFYKAHKQPCSCACCCNAQGKPYYFPRNRYYWFMGVGFLSNVECEVAKLKFKEIGIVPIPEVNCHIQVDGKVVDFYNLGCFEEFHPMNGNYENGRPRVEYYKERRELLDKNGYKKYPLIHWTSLREVEDTLHFLKKISVVT